MNEKSKKLVRYSTAAAALLAVSGGANAAIVPGTIMTEYDGDTYDNILDYHGDAVLLDVNDDGEPDFVAYMSSFSFSIYSIRSFWINALNAEYDYTGMFEVDSNFSPIFSTSFPYLNNFQMNQAIGPLNDKSYWGIISNYTEEMPPIPTGPQNLNDPFSPSGDEGYIGFEFYNSSGDTQYGWIHVLIHEDPESVEFIACALETAPAQSILAGSSTAVPLLPIASAAGLGLIGLMAAMKKRRKLTA